MENEKDEIKKDAIDAIKMELMSRELNKALGKTQEYFEVVSKNMQEQYPEKTPEEIGEIYDQMCEEEKLKMNNKETEVNTEDRD